MQSLLPPHEVLRLKLADRGLSQAELSRRTGMSKVKVSNLCNGKQDIGLSESVKITGALHIKDFDFFWKLQKQYRRSMFERR